MPSVFFESLKKIVSYAVPISVAQLVRILTPIVSTVMIAHLGILPLAASSLVGSYYLVSMLFGFGMVFSVTIQASQHIGAKDYAAATRSVVNGIWLAGGIGLIALLLYILGPVILILFGQDPKIVALTPYYFYTLLVAFYFKRITGNPVFVGGIISQAIIFYIFYADIVSYLWLNIIGALLVIIISHLLQFTVMRKTAAE